MKILIAPDSFKNCLTARQVAQNIRTGIQRIIPDAAIRDLPVADGGEGTVQALVDATGGEIISTVVVDPLMRKVESFYGILGDKKTVVIEMAAASGLELIYEAERNPALTTTYGTGQLIKKALDNGAEHIIIGIGGSATNDGGAGMVEALGGKFRNQQGFDALLSITDKPMRLEDAMRDAGQLLQDAAAGMIRLVVLGSQTLDWRK